MLIRLSFPPVSDVLEDNEQQISEASKLVVGNDTLLSSDPQSEVSNTNIDVRAVRVQDSPAFRSSTSGQLAHTLGVIDSLPNGEEKNHAVPFIDVDITVAKRFRVIKDILDNDVQYNELLSNSSSYNDKFVLIATNYDVNKNLILNIDDPIPLHKVLYDDMFVLIDLINLLYGKDKYSLLDTSYDPDYDPKDDLTEEGQEIFDTIVKLRTEFQADLKRYFFKSAPTFQEDDITLRDKIWLEYLIKTYEMLKRYYAEVDYLDNEPLKQFIARFIAENYIEGKTVEEIRLIIGVHADFTQEELDDIENFFKLDDDDDDDFQK